MYDFYIVESVRDQENTGRTYGGISQPHVQPLAKSQRWSFPRGMVTSWKSDGDFADALLSLGREAHPQPDHSATQPPDGFAVDI